MRKFMYLLLFLIQPYFSLADQTNSLKEELILYKAEFPVGDISNINYVKLAIDYMYEFDQRIRNIFVTNPNNPEITFIIKQIDEFNTIKLKEILKYYGWINISKFGKEYDYKTWLLVQHADQMPFFQIAVLFMLSNMVLYDETDKKNYAYLYDRIAIKFSKVGIYQKFGTQVNIDDNGNVRLLPYQDNNIENLDKNREKYGLPPIKEYLGSIREFYNKK